MIKTQAALTVIFWTSSRDADDQQLGGKPWPL
jgi:hypothetical protein